MSGIKTPPIEFEGEITLGAVEIKDAEGDAKAAVRTDGDENALVVVQNHPRTTGGLFNNVTLTDSFADNVMSFDIGSSVTLSLLITYNQVTPNAELDYEIAYNDDNGANWFVPQTVDSDGYETDDIRHKKESSKIKSSVYTDVMRYCRVRVKETLAGDGDYGTVSMKFVCGR